MKGGAFRFIPLDVLWGARISSSCGQQNVKSSGFIVITYHARDITLLISAVFKHRRSSGAQTLLIFLGGRFWTKADEFYWTHSQGAAQKFLPFSRNIQSLSPSFTSSHAHPPPPWPHRWRKIKLQIKPAKQFAPARCFTLWSQENDVQTLHGRNVTEFDSFSKRNHLQANTVVRWSVATS